MKAYRYQSSKYNRAYTSIVSFVYIIKQVDDDILKVGVSAQPVKRLSQINTDSPSTFKIEYVVPVSPRYVGELEKRSHEIMEEYALKGEWFRCDLDVAKEKVNTAVQQLHHKYGMDLACPSVHLMLFPTDVEMVMHLPDYLYKNNT